jgi:Ser/Thr protein kinase RdoA (MazF antagonist)
LYDEDGGFWRVMNYIDSVTANLCDNLDVIRNTGRAFGDFQMQLVDFDGKKLVETIPDFHNTEKRLQTLFSNASADSLDRVKDAKDELEYITSVYDKACSLCRRYYRGDFPIRVTHNDTKSNNVLFDKDTFEPIVIIDLDTVMPGMAMYDFGDAVRFIANTANEDESNLSKVSFDTVKFRAFCEGYISQVKNALTKDELDCLVLGAFSITIELASRFLDDYLTGDSYFKIDYPNHNLIRAKCQLHLAKDIMNKFDELKKTVLDVMNRSI